MTKKQRSLGVARHKRRYDLPLNKGAGTRFLLLLIALMTWLGMLALSGSFALQAMTERWSSGLEGRITVEIPAEDTDGKLLTSDEIKLLSSKIAAMLNDRPEIARTTVMSESDIRELVRPWLGDSQLPGDLPLPGLISAELVKNTKPEALHALAARIKDIAPHARLETHEGWLKDLLRFTGALQFAAALLTFVIAITTVTAVAGAIQARMAIHHEEVELLHLMGAADRYIARQFQRHSLILAFQGGLAGMMIGALTLFIIGWLSGRMDINLLPDFHLTGMQMAVLAALPVIAALIATFTARLTVYRVLAQMP
ncbi:MAG: permease [Rhodospirillales bacterium]|nr:permease [Rhodospirillales bacterium]